MEAIISFGKFLYCLWMLIFGLFFVKNKPVKGWQWGDYFALSLRRVFWGWCGFAVIYLVIVLSGGQTIGIIQEPANSIFFLLTGLVFGSITIFLDYQKRWKNYRQLMSTRRIEQMNTVPAEQFEKLVSEFFSAFGYRVFHAGMSGDHGVDVVVMTPAGEKWVVQCKRYKGSVGEPMVRDLLGTMVHEKASKAFLITTGSFTKAARAWAKNKPIVLYDGETFLKLIARLRAKQKINPA